MDDKSILSLCVVVSVSENLMKLFRIADVKNNSLVPFQKNPRDMSPYSVDLIHPKGFPEVDAIGFWKWEAYLDDDGKSWQNATSSDDTWIEFIQFADVATWQQLRETLSGGIENIQPDHQFLMAYSQHSGIIKCVLCNENDFIMKDNIAFLKDSIATLPAYSIHANDIANLPSSRYSQVTAQYYKYPSLPRPVKKEFLKNPYDIIKAEIKANIRSYAENPTTSERRVIKGMLDSLPDTSLVDVLMDGCGCTREEGQSYIFDFVNRCEQFLSGEDVGSKVLERFASRETEVNKRLRDAVQKDWESNHAALLKDANKELIDKQHQLTAISKNINDLTSSLAKLKKEHDTQKKKTEDQKKLGLEIEHQIKQKMADARKAIVSFLAEHALFTGVQDHPSTSDTAAMTHRTPRICGNTLSDSPYAIENIRDAFEVLQDNLLIAGVSERMRGMLAAYLLAAYIKRIPLLIAGYGADIIVDALSATLRNRSADRVYCYPSTNAELFSCQNENDIAVIFDGFQGGAISKTLQGLHDVKGFVCFVVATSEELAIEPKGIFDYALPLFTEFFLEKPKSEEWIGSICELTLKVDRVISAKITLPKALISPFALHQCKALLSEAASILGDSDIFESYLLQTMPIMLALNQATALIDLITASTLSDNEKALLHELCGENQ